MQLLHIFVYVLQIFILLWLHVQFNDGILHLPLNWRLKMEI